jgi:hypothetical protein
VIDRYGCGTSDGDGEGLRDCSDASERDGEGLRLVGGDLVDDRGIKRFDDAAAALFPTP